MQDGTNGVRIGAQDGTSGVRIGAAQILRLLAQAPGRNSNSTATAKSLIEPAAQPPPELKRRTLPLAVLRCQVSRQARVTDLRHRRIAAEVQTGRAYFTTGCFAAVIAAGAPGEIANVSHVFQPGARLVASNSPMAFRLKKPCKFPRSLSE